MTEKYPAGCAADLIWNQINNPDLSSLSEVQQGLISQTDLKKRKKKCEALLRAISNPDLHLHKEVRENCENCPLGKLKGAPGYKKVVINKLGENIYNNRFADTRWNR